MRLITGAALAASLLACAAVSAYAANRMPILGAGGSGITYYVDTAGSDSNDGKSPATAWQTITKVNGATFQPGDSVLFKGGASFSLATAISCGSGGQATTTSLCLTSSHLLGTAAAPVTIGSYGTGQATITATTNSSALMAYNVGGFNLQNLTFVGSGTTTPQVANAWAGVLVENDQASNTHLDGVTIFNITVHGFSENGLFVRGANGSSGYTNLNISYVTAYSNTSATDGSSNDGAAAINVSSPVSDYGHGASTPAFTNVLIDHCYTHDNVGNHGGTITNWTGSGIFIGEASNGTIQYSVAGNNGSGSSGSVAIWAADGTGITIQYNEAYGEGSNSANDGDGFDLDGGITNSVMQYNYSHGNQGAGFQVYTYNDGTVTSTTNSTVRYNVSQGDDTKTSQPYGAISIADDGGTMTGIFAYNNTLYYTTTTGPGAIQVGGSSASSIGAKISNNIIYVGSGANLVSSLGSNATPASVVFTGNDYFAVGTFAIKWGTNAGTTYSTLSAWQGTGQEKISSVAVGTTSNPSLTTPGGGTTTNTTPGNPSSQATAYLLQSGSAMKAAGQNIASLYSTTVGTFDFFGNTLSGSSWNIGADSSP